MIQARTLSSPGFDEETRRYMQGRLRILTGTVASITAILAAAFLASLLWNTEAGIVAEVVTFCTEPPNAILFWMVVGSSAMWLLLRRRQLSHTALGVVDAVFLQLLVIPCLILYAREHHFAFAGFPVVVPFLTLFVLTRAVLVPSTALRTALLSLPAALGVLAIQLWHGASYAFPEQPYPAGHFSDMLMQNQVILLGAVGVATFASKINLGLRRRTYDARRLGQYELVRLIGSGAMGEVYEANHALLKRPTAIKLLRPEISGRGSLRRFEREVQQTSRLSHPNTVSIFDYGHTAEGVFYYAMELLDGATLRDIVEASGPLPPARVIHVLSGACGALAEAHGKGMVHRDIKAANVMLCEQGGEHDVVKILDFGLVKDILHDSDLDAAIMGTPETMAPEAVAPHAVGPRSDLYSLAAVGYYLLTGTPVFTADSAAEYLRKHRGVRPDPPSSRVEGVPGDLEQVILRGLGKDPDARPRTAAVMRSMLLACEDAGRWSPDDAAAWWRDFVAPTEHEPSRGSSGSPMSVIETAIFPDE